MKNPITYINALTDIPSRKLFSNMLQSEGLCYDDLDEIDGELKLALDKKDNVIGGYGLEVFGKNALLRSVIISKEFRGSGKGNDIVEMAMENARLLGVEQLFLLTTTADRFFAKLGFERVPRTSVPDSIGNTTEFKTFCPDTAVCMKLKI